VSHLGARVSALVDGELGHEARDRALAHVAHCATCRQQLETERAIKAMVAGSPTPEPSADLLASLTGMAEPGGPVGPRARPMPLGPVVPTLPPPGRRPLGRRRDSRRPDARGRRPSHRLRYATVGAISFAGLVLGTAFAAGGTGGPAGSPAVVPPAAGLAVEHAATTSGFTFGDPAFSAVTASFGGLTVPGAAEPTP
jgi:hypothetical protein